jgi:hypothetical protein
MKDTITVYQFVNEMAQAQQAFQGKVRQHCSNTLNNTNKTQAKKWNLTLLLFVATLTNTKVLKMIKENYQDIETLEDLQNHTTVIEIPNSDRLIIQAF